MSGLSARFPGYPGLRPLFGSIVGIWYVQNPLEQVALVEEESIAGRWWVLYLLRDTGWVVMGTFVVDDERVLRTVPLFTEVVDVAVPVDPRQPFYFVVEENEEYMWWVVYWTQGFSVEVLVLFVSRREEFVVPL
jgi:hypothetical protein